MSNDRKVQNNVSEENDDSLLRIVVCQFAEKEGVFWNDEKERLNSTLGQPSSDFIEEWIGYNVTRRTGIACNDEFKLMEKGGKTTTSDSSDALEPQK